MYDESTAVRDTSKPKKTITECISSLTLRHYLLGWAYFRLIVSIFWSIAFFIFTVTTVIHISECYTEKNAKTYDCSYRLMMALVASAAQIVEMGMIITFIIAGRKKSVKLYSIYWYYCLFTLPVYILVVATDILPVLPFDAMIEGLYITFHIPEMITLFRLTDFIFFFLVFIVDVCLEITLILLVRKQIMDIRNEVKTRFENNEDFKTNAECTVKME